MHSTSAPQALVGLCRALNRTTPNVTLSSSDPMKKLVSLCTLALMTLATLTMVAHPAKAEGDVQCADNGVDTAVCVDEDGNAAISTVDDEGNQVTVDSDGNYEIEFAS